MATIGIEKNGLCFYVQHLPRRKKPALIAEYIFKTELDGEIVTKVENHLLGYLNGEEEFERFKDIIEKMFGDYKTISEDKDIVDTIMEIDGEED